MLLSSCVSHDSPLPSFPKHSGGMGSEEGVAVYILPLIIDRQELWDLEVVRTGLRGL